MTAIGQTQRDTFYYKKVGKNLARVINRALERRLYVGFRLIDVLAKTVAKKLNHQPEKFLLQVNKLLRNTCVVSHLQITQQKINSCCGPLDRRYVKKKKN